jgi:hypothetical protein
MPLHTNQPHQHSITFLPSGRGAAQGPPDPNYPHGIQLDLAQGASPSCTIDLPYPAPECGLFLIKCPLCEVNIAVTCAGRVDDPTRIIIPCRLQQVRSQPS